MAAVLPPEVLSKIFSSLKEKQPIFQVKETVEYLNAARRIEKERLDTLCSAALVCNGWTAPAQGEMWSLVAQNAERFPLRIRRFITSQGTMMKGYRTKQLRLRGYFTTFEDVYRAVMAPEGVQTLELGAGGIHVSVLEFGVLSEVSHLILGAGLIFDCTVTKLPTFRFNLTQLTIELSHRGAWPLDLITCLLQPTVTSLAIVFPRHSLSGDVADFFLELIEPHAPRITNLRLVMMLTLLEWLDPGRFTTPTSNQLALDRIGAFLASFSNVLTLTCDLSDVHYFTYHPDGSTLNKLVIERCELGGAELCGWETLGTFALDLDEQVMLYRANLV